MTVRGLKAAFVDLVKRVRRDFGLRILSLMIALGLWLFVNAGQRGAVVTLHVPVSYRTLPRGLMIMNRPPDFVHIDVAGPRTLLSLLDPERLTLRLNLAGVPIGNSDFRIEPGMFNVPRQTSVTRITPSEVNLDVDRVVSRDVPVHLNIAGAVANGYQIDSHEVKPALVTVTGPSRYVMATSQVESEPIDVGGVSATFDRIVPLAPVMHDMTLSVDHIDARIDVTEQIANREFRGIPVDVRNSDYKYRVEPEKATITLRGPLVRLAALDPKGLVYVEAKGDTPGSHDLPLMIDLPDGMQVVKQSPNRVRLKIYREKRTTAVDGKAS